MDPSQVTAFLDQPALSPPEGVVPNLRNPDNLADPELAVLQLAVTTVVVGIRLYTKGVVIGKMLAEDYWLMIAWIFFAGFHVIVFMFESLPLGVHLWDMTVRKAIEHARLFQIAIAIYSLTILPLKTSLILQIRRIFLPHSRSLHSRPLLLWTIDCFLVLNILFYVALFLFQFLACRPLAHAWDPLVEGVCVRDRLVVHIVSASINTASDVVIVVLPQPVIWGLEIGRGRKWGLSCVFLLGGLACAASSIRLYYAILLHSSPDHTYRAALMGKWAEPELTFGFLAAALPVFPAFLKHLVRTSWGLRLRTLWTQSPMSSAGVEESGGRGKGRGKTVRSLGREGARIVKVVQMDVEFEELTRESGEGSEGRERERERDDEWSAGEKVGSESGSRVWPYGA